MMKFRATYRQVRAQVKGWKKSMNRPGSILREEMVKRAKCGALRKFGRRAAT